MTQRLRYDACIPKNLDDEVDSASSLRFVSLHQMVKKPKNQTLNFFVLIFVVVAIQKKKRRDNSLASSLFKLQQQKSKQRKFGIWQTADVMKQSLVMTLLKKKV